MTTQERNEGLLYILIFGTSHAWITWMYASTSLRAGAIMGACCILIWLILWFFIRQQLRIAAQARRVWSRAQWNDALNRDRSRILRALNAQPTFPPAWREPAPTDAWSKARRAIRGLARSRRRYAADQWTRQELDRLMTNSREPVTFNLSTDEK